MSDTAHTDARTLCAIGRNFVLARVRETEKEEGAATPRRPRTGFSAPTHYRPSGTHRTSILEPLRMNDWLQADFGALTKQAD
jgi:hypothetical protein